MQKPYEVFWIFLCYTLYTKLQYTQILSQNTQENFYEKNLILIRMEPAMKLLENQKLRMNTDTCLCRFHKSMYMYRVQFIRHSIWGISTILLQKYFYKKLVKTAIKLYPILHDHYPDRFNDIPRPNRNYCPSGMYEPIFLSTQGS